MATNENDRILERMRGVPAGNMSMLEMMMDGSNPQRLEANDNVDPTPEQRAKMVTETKVGGFEEFEALIAKAIRDAEDNVLMVLAPFAMHAKALDLDGRSLGATIYSCGNSALCVGAFQMARDMCFGRRAEKRLEKSNQ